MVDDMIFFREVNISELLVSLNKDPKIYCMHMKLYPGICYSHTNNKLVSIPKFTHVENQTKYLKFRRSETQYDWNYPFDFCGSIYRLNSIISIIDLCEEPNKMLKPNTFEFIGNMTIKKKLLTKDQPYSMCFNDPVMTVVTVNKV